MKPLIVLFAAVVFSGCIKMDDDQSHCPEAPCVYAAVETFKNSTEICPDGASVKEYQWEGKTVYVFDPGICIADGQARVQDGDCKLLGYLGGIAGNSKIEGKEFGSAVLKRVLWEN